MITIHQPYIEICEENTFLRCEVTDSGMGVCHSLWFSVDNEYAQYLNDDRADAFLMIMLQVAMKSKQDIIVESTVSETLLYNLTNAVMPVLNKIYPEDSVIRISAPITRKRYDGNAVGTGCSLGVDSLSTIIDASSEKFPEPMRLTHLALFNSGQHGDNNLEEAEKQFKKDLDSIREPALEMGLKVVGINSNVNEIFKLYEYPLLHRFIITTCAFPLILQKLFKSYIYASGYPIESFQLNPDDIAHAEFAIIPLLGTETIAIRTSNPTYSRVGKTRILAGSSIARRYLNVCWSHQIAYMSGSYVFLDGKTKLNCGMCDKCLRTLFTLELLGILDQFKEIFDIDAYRKYRNKYIVKVLSGYRKDVFMEEIFNLMKSSGFKVPPKARMMAFGVRIGLYSMAQKLFGLSVMNKGK